MSQHKNRPPKKFICKFCSNVYEMWDEFSLHITTCKPPVPTIIETTQDKPVYTVLENPPNDLAIYYSRIPKSTNTIMFKDDKVLYSKNNQLITILSYIIEGIYDTKNYPVIYYLKDNYIYLRKHKSNKILQYTIEEGIQEILNACELMLEAHTGIKTNFVLDIQQIEDTLEYIFTESQKWHSIMHFIRNITFLPNGITEQLRYIVNQEIEFWLTKNESETDKLMAERARLIIQ